MAAKTTQAQVNEDSLKTTKSKASTTKADENKTDAETEVAPAAPKRGDTGLDDVTLASDEGAPGGEVVDGEDVVAWGTVTPADFEDAPEVRTSDSDDPNKSWHVQATGDDDETPVNYVTETPEPGQVFEKEELPNVDSLKKAGIDPVQFLSGLPVRT